MSTFDFDFVIVFLPPLLEAARFFVFDFESFFGLLLLLRVSTLLLLLPAALLLLLDAAAEDPADVFARATALFLFLIVSTFFLAALLQLAIGQTFTDA